MKYTEQGIKGQCEHCGNEYQLMTRLYWDTNITCPKCGELTDNWDTVDSSMFAPFIVGIINNKLIK